MDYGPTLRQEFLEVTVGQPEPETPVLRREPEPGEGPGALLDVILLAVRWYLRFGLSYSDLEERSCRSVASKFDHVTLYRWVQRFTPLVLEAARPCRQAVGDRWFVDESYVKVAGTWRYVYRAVDQNGQVIDVYVSKRRDTAAATRFFTTAITAHGEPVEVTTDKAQVLAPGRHEP